MGGLEGLVGVGVAFTHLADHFGFTPDFGVDGGAFFKESGFYPGKCLRFGLQQLLANCGVWLSEADLP